MCNWNRICDRISMRHDPSFNGTAKGWAAPGMYIKRILIVDDDEPTRDILRLIFRRLGWEATAVGTIAEGMALLDRDPPPDGLLLDLDLPDGRGETVLRKVRD